MDEEQLLEIIKAENSDLFGGTLTDETATVLLRAVLRTVRERVRGIEEGRFSINGLGIFRVRRVERAEQEERIVRKVVNFSLQQVADPQLAAIAKRHYGKGSSGFARKPASFLAEYERLFAAIRYEPLRVLELGVNAGESLLMWRDYFPNGLIVGIDIRDRPQLVAGEPRIHFVKGSQDEPKALEEAAAIAGRPFDIIIDDASHIGYLTKRSLHYLFPRWLRPRGYYVVEDIGTAFWSFVPDGAPFPRDEADEGPQAAIFRSHQHGILGVTKQLIDQTMKVMATGTPSALEIERITFLDGLVVIRKAVHRSD